MPNVNPKVQVQDEVVELFDRLARLALMMEDKVEQFSIEELRRRHDEDQASPVKKSGVNWNVVSQTLLWFAVLLLIAREIMT